ncbi:hypothetical protein K2X33_07465 [bacterium]|nr:hypothetical protein [bacterium]
MPKLETTKLSQEAIDRLRRELARLPEEATLASSHPDLASQIASLGIWREVGTVNDELARFIFDAESGKPVPREKLKARFVMQGRLFGVEIHCEGHPRLDIRARHFRTLLHPKHSFNDDGTVGQLVIFPEIISEIVRRQGVETVLVRKWGENSIFGGFDPAQGYYQTNFWELENNDALFFSGLVQRRQLAFLGTHDLIAHLAGVNRASWESLSIQGARVHQTIQGYFQSTPKATVASLILPYTAGVVLDDLAQPPTYGSRSHSAVLEELLGALAARRVNPGQKVLMTEFPQEFQSVIELSRAPGAEGSAESIKQTVGKLIGAIHRHSVQFAA